MPLLELGRLMGPICPGGGGSGLTRQRNPMESASPALSIRAAASRNKPNKHPAGPGRKGPLTHGPESHPPLRCFVWSWETWSCGVGARPWLTTILLPRFGRVLPLAMGVCFSLGLGRRRAGWEWETSNPAPVRQYGVRQTKLWQKSPSCGLT